MSNWKNKFIENPDMLGVIGQIAKNILCMETLDPENCDKLVLQDIAVRDIRLALKLAYMAGSNDQMGSAS